MKLTITNDEGLIEACIYINEGRVHEDSWIKPGGWSAKDYEGCAVTSCPNCERTGTIANMRKEDDGMFRCSTCNSKYGAV